MIPAWISPNGLLWHLCVGAATSLALKAQGVPFVVRLEVAAGLGIAHEIGDRDLMPGAVAWPWNGLLDVLAFVVGAALA